MEKLFRLKVSQEQVDILSDVISEFINTIEDRCDGAFTTCYKKGKSLEQVNLFIVTTDDDLINTIHNKLINNSICTIKVIGINTNNFANNKSEYSIDSLLKSGKIIYDKDGILRMHQRAFEKNKSVAVIQNKNIVNIKPPIQYTRKPR